MWGNFFFFSVFCRFFFRLVSGEGICNAVASAIGDWKERSLLGRGNEAGVTA